MTIFNKADPTKTYNKTDKLPFCPATWERDSLFFFDGKGVENTQGALKIKAGRKDDKHYKFSLSTSDFELEATFPVAHDSIMWMTPLSDDKRKYFATVKKAGIPLDPFTYTYKGQKFSSK